MTNLKVGDTVRILKNTINSHNKVGEIGEVTEVSIRPHKDRSHVRVQVLIARGNAGNWSLTDEVELVEALDPREYAGVSGHQSGKTAFASFEDVLRGKTAFASCCEIPIAEESKDEGTNVFTNGIPVGENVWGVKATDTWSDWFIRSAAQKSYPTKRLEWERIVLDANTVAVRYRLKEVVEPVYSNAIFEGHWDEALGLFYKQKANAKDEHNCTVTIELKDGKPYWLSGHFTA